MSDSGFGDFDSAEFVKELKREERKSLEPRQLSDTLPGTAAVSEANEEMKRAKSSMEEAMQFMLLAEKELAAAQEAVGKAQRDLQACRKGYSDLSSMCDEMEGDVERTSERVNGMRAELDEEYLKIEQSIDEELAKLLRLSD